MMMPMLESLDRNELAKLHAKFVVPIAVECMLRGEEPLDDVAEYSMHEIISELEPDTALLCVALCAQHVAASASHLLISHALKAEADMIVNEYGPYWLAHEAGANALHDKDLRELLAYIPEDLEALGDLLEGLEAELDEKHAIAAILCDILKTQARSQMEFAEFELEAINEKMRPANAKKAAAPAGEGNVIQFPQMARR
jgi:hypothetical protein